MACGSSRTAGRKQEEDARGAEARPFRAESSHLLRVWISEAVVFAHSAEFQKAGTASEGLV